jgi:hypothetical protein
MINGQVDTRVARRMRAAKIWETSGYNSGGPSKTQRWGSGTAVFAALYQ